MDENLNITVAFKMFCYRDKRLPFCIIYKSMKSSAFPINFCRKGVLNESLTMTCLRLDLDDWSNNIWYESGSVLFLFLES